jgi:hypothetical protein
MYVGYMRYIHRSAVIWGLVGSALVSLVILFATMAIID